MFPTRGTTPSPAARTSLRQSAATLHFSDEWGNFPYPWILDVGFSPGPGGGGDPPLVFPRAATYRVDEDSAVALLRSDGVHKYALPGPEGTELHGLRALQQPDPPIFREGVTRLLAAGWLGTGFPQLPGWSSTPPRFLGGRLLFPPPELLAAFPETDPPTSDGALALYGFARRTYLVHSIEAELADATYAAGAAPRSRDEVILREASFRAEQLLLEERRTSAALLAVCGLEAPAVLPPLPVPPRLPDETAGLARALDLRAFYPLPGSPPEELEYVLRAGWETQAHIQPLFPEGTHWEGQAQTRPERGPSRVLGRVRAFRGRFGQSPPDLEAAEPGFPAWIRAPRPSPLVWAQEFLTHAEIIARAICDPRLSSGPTPPQNPILGAGGPRLFGDLLVMAASLRYFDHPTPEAWIPREFLLEAPLEAWLRQEAPYQGLSHQGLSQPVRRPRALVSQDQTAQSSSAIGSGRSPRNFVLAAVAMDGSSEEEQELVKAAFAGLPQWAPGPVLVARFAAWRSVRTLRKRHSSLQERVWGYVLLAAKMPLPGKGGSSSSAARTRASSPRPKPASFGGFAA